ncbi:hypothetical protein LAZ67_1002395 [Cordylochernes scorpioides]|uniref:Transgelin n=1 Tax=Cordylochernes scorpioides TaxID=51811 RepID=A0ABY6JW21_9ARAC|nr:hypothetical protein LAZ67_1002395 [Cordylochernes scorpioides]
MANRGPACGLSAQVANKLSGKRDPGLEAEILQWIEGVLGERLPAGNFEDVLRDGIILCNVAKATIYKFHLGLELGNISHHIDLPTLWERTLAVHRWRSLSRDVATVLTSELPCLVRLMDKLMPGSIQKVNTSGGQFKLMENIQKFQEAAKRYGVPEIDVFQTVDLYERRNLPQVAQCIMALGRTCIMALGRTCYLHPDFHGPYLGPKPSEEHKRNFTEEQLRAGEGIINLQYGTNKGANQSGQNFGNTRHM